MYTLSARSLKKLEGVHPHLALVAKRAIQITDIDFAVIEGLRDEVRQARLVKDGSSGTMHSKHLMQRSGYGHAIDVAAYVGRGIRWENKFYGPIVQAFMTSAIELSAELKMPVAIEAGHLWLEYAPGKGVDSVHIQLDSRFY